MVTPTYNIKYNLDGGENSEFNPSTYSGTEPVLLREPTKEFYKFVGWYSDSLYRNKATHIENISKDTTYFAKWEYVGYTLMVNLTTNSGELTRVDPDYEGFFEIPSETQDGYSVTNIGADAFFACKKITEIYIPSTVKSIENTAFLGTDSLNYIDVDNYNSSFCTYEGDLYIKPRTRLVRYATGKKAESFILPAGCTYVNDYAFYGSKNLKSVDISETSGIGKFALAECGSLKNVKIGQILNFIDAYAFKKCGLTELTVEGNLYSIGNFAFSECPNLLKLTFNGTIGEIGWSAFKQNSNLISVVFNNKVEKLSTNLFEDCAKLRAISLPQGIKLINKYMFKNCNNLVSVSIPESVTLIEDGAFTSCYSLEKISLHLGISEIQGSPFENCSKLTIYCDAESKPSGWGESWNISNCPVKWGQQGEAGLYDGLSFIEQPDGTIMVGTSSDVEHVIIPESINGKRVTGILADSFKNNTLLKTVTIYARDITVGLYAFEGCTSLESVYVTDIDAYLSIDFQNETANPLSNGADLYVGGWMEYEKVTTLTIPSYIDTVKRYAFYGCTSIERVEFHENIAKLGTDCFKNCTTIKYVTVADANKWCDVVIETQEANPMHYSACDYISNVKITSLNLDVKEVGDYCFTGCNDLCEVILSAENTTRIGKGAFSNCSALESIGIPKIVTYVGKGAFEGCTSLSIYYESLDKPSGWDINWNISNCPVYYGCLDNKTEYYEFSKGQITKYVGSNSSIVIPSEIDGYKVTSIVQGAFTNNKNIVSVVLPSTIVSIDERAFCGCDKLETVIIPEGVKIIGDYAFEDCKSLKSIIIPSTAGLAYNYIFKGCTSLKEATLAEGLISVPNGMFSGCTQLETVNLPSTIQRIGMEAFLNCTSLKSITLPDGLTSIGRSAFSYCTALTEIFIPASVVTIESFAFNHTSDSLVIKCEAESQPDGWASFLFNDKTVLWGQKR